MQIVAQIRNLDEIRRGHDFFLARNERLIEATAERAGRHAEDHVRRHPLFKPRTGRTQKKTGHRVVRTSGGRLLRIFNTAKHAAALDSGARPHLIRARFRNKLRFRGKSGAFVFRESVRHPGNRPYKFLFRATNSAYRVMGQDLARGMTELAKNF